MEDAYRLIRAFSVSTSEGINLLNAEPNLIDSRTSMGETPLHYLTVENQLEAVQTLVKLGSNINTVNDVGGTPLSEAAELGYVDLVKFLISAGAKLCLEGQSEPVLNQSVISGNIEIVQTLLDAGADLNSPDALGNTALHIAAAKNDVEIVKMLIKAGADTKIRRVLDETPLETARNSGSTEAEQILAGLDD